MPKDKSTTPEISDMPAMAQHSARLVADFHGVRYHTRDVARAVEFYTGTLGFRLEHEQLPDFAAVSLGSLKLLLSNRPAAGAGPGTSNRLVLRVDDLGVAIEELKKIDVPLRNELESGPGGRHVQIEDPDGNPIELFEPASARA